MNEPIQTPQQPASPTVDLGHIAPDLRALAVRVDSLSPDPANARSHGPRNLDIIAGSLRRFGQVKAIVVNRDGIILAGNGSWLAARALGWEYIAATRVDFDPTTAAAFGVADNRSSDTSEWDNDALAAILGSLNGDADLIAATGFDPGEVEKLLRDASGGGELPADAGGKEYTEAVADDVKKCPHCGMPL